MRTTIFVLSGINISSKIVPGFFSVTFSYILYVISPFLGPAVPPPHKGTSNMHFLEEFAIGIKVVILPT